LKSLCGENPIALGKMLKADGLLSVEKGRDGFHVRLAAVRLGYVLFDDFYPEGDSIGEVIKIIGHKTAGYAPKLRVSTERAKPVSVMNFRAEISSQELTTLERKLTLLLESYLAADPNVIVLERRHSWSIAFERSLDESPSAVTRGAYWIDGSVRESPGLPGAVAVRLRLRHPDGRMVEKNVIGRGDDLQGLARSIWKDFESELGKKTTVVDNETVILDEAREYLKEGVWEKRKIPSANANGLHVVDDRIYIELGQAGEGGLARYDWDHDELIILASSRRRPGQNQFDDCAGYQSKGPFAGPSGKLCTHMWKGSGVYYVQEEPGNWPAVCDLPAYTIISRQGRVTLAVAQQGVTVLLDPSLPEPKYLMCPKSGAGKKSAYSWSDQALWETPKDWKKVIYDKDDADRIGYYKGNLYAFQTPNETRRYCELLWLEPGRKEPFHIPLQLLFQGSEEEGCKKAWPRWAITPMTLKQGICLKTMYGFWFVSFEEIESYLKKLR